MPQTSENRLDDIHRAMIRSIEENANPVAKSKHIRENEAIDISKPTLLKRLDELEEWGEIERAEIGRAYAMWPAGKYEDMEERINELEDERDYYERRVGELEEDLGELEDRAQDAEDELARIESQRPTFLLSGPHPELSGEESQRWREHVTGWWRLFMRYGVIAGISLSFAVSFAIFQSQIEAVLSGISFIPPATFRLFLGVVAFIWIGAALAALVSLLGVTIGLASLRSPTVATGAGWIADKYNTIFSNTDTDGGE